VLSFDTTHALTSVLIAADAAAHHAHFDAAPTLLLIQDYPLPAHPGARAVRAVEIALPAEEPLPRVLHTLAAALAGNGDTTHLGADRDAIAALLAEPLPGLRVLGWGVRYDDLVADAEDLLRVRYIDAVDIDGRVYQLTRRHGEPMPVVLIDEQPDPDDLPAIQPALAALATAVLGGQVRA
jgi:hypothetical protein